MLSSPGSLSRPSRFWGTVMPRDYWMAGHSFAGMTAECAMPLQNRVDPFGELFATPARGAVHGQSRRAHSHRRPNADQAALGVAAMDLLRARFQEPPARRLGPLLHRAVFPRRGDGARRRPPALLRMPAQGCRRLSPGAGRTHSELRDAAAAPTRWTRCCTRAARTAAPSALHRCKYRRPAAMARSLRWSEGAYRACAAIRIAALDALGATTPQQAPAAR